MNNSSEFKHLWAWQAVIVAASPIFGYGLAFAREWGFCSEFDIPLEFIKLDITTVLVTAAILLFIILMLYMAVSFILDVFEPKRNSPITRAFIRLSFGLLLFVGNLIIYRGLWPEWKYYLYFILFLIFVSFIFPLITQIGKGSYIDKLKAQEMKDGMTTTILDSLGRSVFGTIVFIFLVCILLVLFAQSSGKSDAIHQTEYLIPSTYPEAVVLRIYNDSMICANLDRNKHEVERNYFILKISGEPVTMLKLESVGPLKLKK